MVLGITLATECEVGEAGGLIVPGAALATARDVPETRGLIVPGIALATEGGEQTGGLPGRIPVLVEWIWVLLVAGR